ncbi:hypothetical protein Lfu02_14400 [Longispora fulva]|uniref:Uncharacterized protein n=1 Tax=Longispora fulva TaxID=619741 RepID=A0A8J7KJL6_9ACTN|nr:hypothetical protein [Longispora fulva]MBG6140550.1 hypothetical protein [Longispora fulva]GIG57068.1 hypothetical protein Lfu02_14400 [Longispora fulva]
MFKATPEQLKALGEKITGFLYSYGPNEVDAVLFMDADGKFGHCEGPEAAAGCEWLVNRAGVDRLMVLHSYTLLDLSRADGLDAFAELVAESVWLP